ncbi:hypothetical protein B0F90DRAFT_1194856 [Multifurca ochricompacta]|uniref:Uncharacterized protein n=1 Tax=Multifurca ochricompacta TaxID=376703 RepID=A0AAD4M8Q4_9AGAM|nr:hypothetical protein B0F90DRAFT_1194856 [Multifurca ochricompacta]
MNIPSLDHIPRTPSSSSSYFPYTSSPLSESFSPSPSKSAATKLQSRRLAQYKSTATPTRRISSTYSSRQKHATASESVVDVCLSPPVVVTREVENTRSAFFRDRLRERCARRAQQARTKCIERVRRRNGLSSDGEDMCMESDEENDDEVLNDEVRSLTVVPALSLRQVLFQLFRRIIASTSHKNRYSYRLSFQNEVGSSLDPDMEDIAEWERSLKGATACNNLS